MHSPIPNTPPPGLRAAPTIDAGGASVDWNALACTYTGQRFIPGNVIDPLVDGREIFAAMLSAIRGARESILFLTYVYGRGRIAEKFADALAERAEAGVRVHVVLDGIGAYGVSRRVRRRLEGSGARITWFRPTRLKSLLWLFSRTHRKVLVVDQKVAFTGGIGVAEEWEGNGREPAWRDTHFRITGPLVTDLATGFIESWACARQELLDLRPLCLTPPDGGGGAPALAVRSNGPAQWGDIRTLYELLIRHARKRLRISTAYFSPDVRLRELLCAAARRGIAVEIIVPSFDRIDHKVAFYAGARHMAPLLNAGIAIHHYQPAMFHAKILLVDDNLVCFGSGNVNGRSFYKDQELCILADDPALHRKLSGQFDEDLRHATRLTAAAWKARPKHHRLYEWLATLLGRNV